MPGTSASQLPFRRETLSASSKLGASVGTRILLEILTGKMTSMIFCGMLPPLLASEGSRHDGLIENSSSPPVLMISNFSWDLLRDNSGGVHVRVSPVIELYY